MVKDPEEEERIRRRQLGTPVTVDSFNEWRERFDREQAERLRTESSQGMGSSKESSGVSASMDDKVSLFPNESVGSWEIVF